MGSLSICVDNAWYILAHEAVKSKRFTVAHVEAGRRWVRLAGSDAHLSVADHAETTVISGGGAGMAEPERHDTESSPKRSVAPSGNVIGSDTSGGGQTTPGYQLPIVDGEGKDRAIRT